MTYFWLTVIDYIKIPKALIRGSIFHLEFCCIPHLFILMIIEDHYFVISIA